ncbi:flagellar M-ring protein FliF [Clostridium sp. DSM 8431]|uniref:flagellar basal-body MS-ring/collar protein FliF n=1 Tax=Clostridium sp. DSM 8431 TaxID=1761781 RepID=UPI0008F3BD31|nr:flagellar basal-body MS-ring/collar protein FliF [Clostridium sp. DSM 8431]SFU30800.1 flagellar M-ring protein FliF [Clostridium sp. DSM 8431]
MKKLSEFFKKLWTKFKSFSRKIRIAIIVAIVAVLIALVTTIVLSTSKNYEVLFSNLDSTDANTIISKLSEEQISYKVEGDSILVPSEDRDKLRLELSSDLTGSTGYELMDNSKSLGMTDEEFSIMKIRMVQGELEKSIKSLDAVESARVHITEAENSVFVKNATEGSAAVILKLKPGKTLTKEQVKSIVAMVSAATEDIPEQNVQVIDSNMNLLSDGLNLGDSGDGTVSSDSIQSNKQLETQSEEKYANAIVSLLEPVVGKGKVSAVVNVDMDFDSKKTTTTTIDPNKVIVSQQTSKEQSTSSDGATDSGSTVDNNLSNTIIKDDGKVTSSKEEQTTNYDSGKSESTIISSPGEIKRMTASIFIDDGALPADTRDQLEKSVASAIGIDTTRGDEISLVGMAFDTTASDEAKAQVDEFNAQIASQKRNKMIMWGAIAGVIVLAIVAGIIIFARRRKEDDDEDEELENSLDVVIDDTTQYKPIELDIENPQTQIENEIKNYAKEKPDQVADIVKSWLAENER